MDDKNSDPNPQEVRSPTSVMVTGQVKAPAWDAPKIASLLMSITSLVVSLFVFYFLNVQVRHGLQGSLYYVGLNEVRDKDVIRGEFLIANSGNQVEVVRSVAFVLAAMPECHEGYIFSADPVPSPTTLKPGESLVLKLSIAVSADFMNTAKELNFQPGGTFERQAFLCGLFNVIGPDGEPDSAMYRFGAVQVDADGALNGPYDHLTVNRGLIKLHGQSSVPKAKPISVFVPTGPASKSH